MARHNYEFSALLLKTSFRGDTYSGVIGFFLRLSFKGMVKRGQQKSATCFAALRQNELKSDVARFSPHVQTCLATNKGFYKLRKY